VSTQVGDSKTHATIGECIYTNNLTDNIENCRYSPCNARIICKPAEYRKHLGFCSKSCYEHAKTNFRVKNAKFDKWDYQRIRDEIDQAKKLHGEEGKKKEIEEFKVII
jgi:predicted sulfurtransferase